MHNQLVQEYLRVASQFKLGELITEQPHPQTCELSHLTNTNLSEAYGILHAIDYDAIAKVIDKSDELVDLSCAIRDTIKNNHTVYLCGCGATGRLSIVLEVLWRISHQGSKELDSVKAFMAGGDTALIRSIENFEDHPDYGARQLMEMGFSDGDLLISCTEGGETPFVIGATEHAALISSNKPYFLYCNPDDILSKVANRSAKVLDNSFINKINLTCGPMALAGSTRMQASTVLMLAVGAALDNYTTPRQTAATIEQILDRWKGFGTQFMIPFTEAEALIYKNGEYVLYSTDSDLAITILTDTTERSPTFSVVPFENNLDDHPLMFAWCYLFIKNSMSSLDAWESVLRRSPRPLQWSDAPVTSMERFLGYDFSASLQQRRSSLMNLHRHHQFTIDHTATTLDFRLDDFSAAKEISGFSLLTVHLFTKMVLNTHSTLLMGRLGRFQDNIMTYVRPSNYKLIDRAARYVGYLLERRGKSISYEVIIEAVFRLLEEAPCDSPIVLEAVRKLLS